MGTSWSDDCIDDKITVIQSRWLCVYAIKQKVFGLIEIWFDFKIPVGTRRRVKDIYI